jgi:hypothetical protein
LLRHPYASRLNAQWAEDDQAILDDLVTQYLKNCFDDELADCSDEDELQNLSESLDTISSCCGVNVTGYQDQISDRIGELSGPEPDDDDRGIRTWNHRQDDNPHVNPEAEVKRLFDGMR